MKNVITLAATVLVTVGIAIAIMFWVGGSYGEVSPDAYKVAQALYSCCLAKSEPRLDVVESLLDDDGEQPPMKVTDKERQWLEAMVTQARSGNWQSAAAEARQMMNDQVKY